MKDGAWKWVAAICVLAILVAVVGSGEFSATSSTLSRDARGWLAARLYLESRGVDARRLDTTWSEASGGVLVLAFPWQRGRSVPAEELEALGDHLRSGGTVILAYSGSSPQPQEAQVLDALGLEATEVRPPPPLAPAQWWSYHRESWHLEWIAQDGASTPLVVGAFRQAPEAPPKARVLYRESERDLLLVFEYPLHRGRVVALPAAVFANARIGEAGNADFLETLAAWLGPEWIFDEYHHGLAAAPSIPGSASRFAWDLFVMHLALIYLLAVASLARRFGPAWNERAPAAGSTASFLRQLGALHHQLRHHPQAAELLVDRARAFEPDLPFPAEPQPVRAGDGDGLVELARRVSRAQGGAAIDLPRRTP